MISVSISQTTQCFKNGIKSAFRPKKVTIPGVREHILTFSLSCSFILKILQYIKKLIKDVSLRGIYTNIFSFTRHCHLQETLQWLTGNHESFGNCKLGQRAGRGSSTYLRIKSSQVQPHATGSFSRPECTLPLQKGHCQSGSLRSRWHSN